MTENNEIWRMNAFYVSTPSEIMELEQTNMKQLADLLEVSESNLRKKLDPNNNILIKSLAQVYSALNHTLLIFPLHNDVFDFEKLISHSSRYGDFRTIHPHHIASIFGNHIFNSSLEHKHIDSKSAALILAIEPVIKSALENGLIDEVTQAITTLINSLTSAITDKNWDCTQKP